jgi:lipoprotein-anchoring transpeptidase ErfK/SrfK
LRKAASYGLNYGEGWVDFIVRRVMTRIFALLTLAVALLAGAYPAQAQSNDDFFNLLGRSRSQYGNPNAYQGGSYYQRGGYYQGGSYYQGGGYYQGGPSYYGGGSGPIPRELVSAPGGLAPGTIYISTTERRLYLILGNGEALRYGIGVGRDGFGWSGSHRITAKKEWPGWTPPKEMRARRPDLPAYLPGGIENPLGARAMYLGSTLYRIHGSNEPETIGHAVSSGCIRMTNEDVVDLYNRVHVGTMVMVR